MADAGEYLWGYVLTAEQIVQDMRTRMYSAINIWDIKWVPQFPTVIHVNFLAQVWGLRPGVPLKVYVRVVDPATGKVLQNVEAQGSVPENPDTPVQGLTLSLNQIPVRLEGPGNYEVRLLAGSLLVAQHPMLIRKAP